MIDSVICNVLVGVIVLLGAIPCIGISARIAKQKEPGGRLVLYGTGIFLGVSMWMHVIGLLLFMSDETYRSGVLFIIPFAAIAMICMLYRNMRTARSLESRKKRILKVITGVLGPVLWLGILLVFNYAFGVVLSTAFFVLSDIQELYIFLGALFGVGVLIMIAAAVFFAKPLRTGQANANEQVRVKADDCCYVAQPKQHCGEEQAKNKADQSSD